MSTKSRKIKVQPQQLWAFWANTFGPFYTTPQRVYFKDGMGNSWWHKNQNHDISGVGEHRKGGYVTFAHTDKKVVQSYIDGFSAAQHLLRSFVRSSYDDV